MLVIDLTFYIDRKYTHIAFSLPEEGYSGLLPVLMYGNWISIAVVEVETSCCGQG